MADGPRQQYRTVLFIAQMLDGLLTKQGLDGRGGAGGGGNAGLVTQDDGLFRE
jgi:hypothetical protein